MEQKHFRQMKPSRAQIGYLLVVVTSLIASACEMLPDPQPRQRPRPVIPRGIDSLLIIPQVITKGGWFGPDYGALLEPTRSAFTRVALSRQYTVVAPREDIDHLIRERWIGQQQAIIDSEAIRIGRNAAASGVVILSVSIVQGTRYPEQPPFDVYFGPSRSYRRNTPVKQPYAEVTVTARLLDVYSGTIVWEGEGNYGQMNPSNLGHVVTQAVFDLGF